MIGCINGIINQPMTIKNKAVAYCRVSSKEQEETGYSLPAQEKLLKEYADRKGLDTVKVFSVAESASGAKQRKVFAEMMEYVEKNDVKHLIVEKVDRLTRNLKEAVVANDWVDHDIERMIHFVKNNLVIHKDAKSDEKFRWDIEIVLAKKFIANLSEEVKKGQAEKIAQGWLPTKPPLGYKTVGDKGHKTHVVDEGKATFIRKMFELYSTGNYSTPALVSVMYKEGLRSRAGKEVGKSRLYDMLSDPFYCGMMKWNEQVFPAKHEAIITKDLFDLVQGMMRRKFKVPQYQKHLPVFKAKIDCTECRGTITWEIQKGHWYGHCNHHKTCSQKKWRRQEAVETALFPLFDNVAPKTPKVLDILKKALKESHSHEVDYYAKSVTEINRSLQISKMRLDAIYEDRIDRTITPEFYDRKSKEYTKDRDDAVEALKKLGEGSSKYYEAGIAIHELASRASEIYKSEKATVEDKRLLLSKIFSNLSLNTDGIKPDYTLAFEFLREWVPVLNSTFEPEKTVATKRQKDPLGSSHPALLRG